MLSIVSTPIGNIEDITLRAITTLFTADVVLCEDTRRTGQLLHLIKERFPALVPAQTQLPLLQPYYDEVEFKVVPEIISLLEQQKTIALVSDSGTPLVSDPGFLLVRECRKRGLPVTAVPGPTAAVAALTISGLPFDSVYMAGFLPEKEGQRKKRLQELRAISKTTLICYCAPHKLIRTLENIQEVFGELFEITLARELTKIHEQIWTGAVRDALQTEPIGEYVLLWYNS